MNSNQSTQDDQTNDPGAVLPPMQLPQQPVQQAQPQASAQPPAPLAPEPAMLPQEQTIPDSRALVPTPGEASDSDLIEKEWVDKAKQIVEHTAEDPFNQQESLSKMKADYLKKRYNKDLGTGY